jgi:hypothetical protein
MTTPVKFEGLPTGPDAYAPVRCGRGMRGRRLCAYGLGAVQTCRPARQSYRCLPRPPCGRAGGRVGWLAVLSMLSAMARCAWRGPLGGGGRFLIGYRWRLAPRMAGGRAYLPLRRGRGPAQHRALGSLALAAGDAVRLALMMRRAHHLLATAPQ